MSNKTTDGVCRSKRHTPTGCYACLARARRSGVSAPRPVRSVEECLALALSVYGPVARAHLEDYFELTREFKFTLPEAAARIPISERMAWRYEASINAALEESR
jgi:hypothetical protein